MRFRDRMRFRAKVAARALLFLPSTLFHESAHLVVALLTGCRIRSFSLLPKIDWENGVPAGVTFGHVAYVPPLPLVKVPVSLAPLLLLPLAWMAARSAGLSLDAWPPEFDYRGIDTLLWGYVASQLLFGALPSSHDFGEALDGLRRALEGLASLAWKVLAAAALAGLAVLLLER